MVEIRRVVGVGCERRDGEERKGTKNWGRICFVKSYPSLTNKQFISKLKVNTLFSLKAITDETFIGNIVTPSVFERFWQTKRQSMVVLTNIQILI